MNDILETIVAHKRQELEMFKQFLPPRKLYSIVEKDMSQRTTTSLPSMRQSLMSSDTGIIAEFKRKSPSKGWINQHAKADVVPLQYQQNGASAVSILTDANYFGGYDEYIMCARESGVILPILYKNFVIDEYQLLQAVHCGASAVLLIAACLDKGHCRQLISSARQLGLEVLLEMHGDRDFDYAELLPDMYGINNRNLGSFVTDVSNSFRLADRLPEGVCMVSESGLKDAATIMELRRMGFRGFLMGEHFMQTANPGLALKSLIDDLNR